LFAMPSLAQGGRLFNIFFRVEIAAQARLPRENITQIISCVQVTKYLPPLAQGERVRERS
jgi:hypothetical protein